ncbi:hypothetical protein [Pseudomonas sp. PDM13]|uniref:hypothetical protein n=1 Tax=Pseudomonas sp. PDM13 TaxID=2769255 RepID=UPI0021DF902B|nr:hypothetical protein [Pseudomonas sp. PDM13]MCU9947535.1 hypothetical protein [Pseudomonas sp. PDM13]
MTEQTLSQLLQERVAVYAGSDRPRELIDQGIDEMFKNLVKDMCRSYGDLSKAIEGAIKAALPANVGDVFELTKYNAMIAAQLKERWEQSAFAEHLLKQADASIAEVLSGEGLITGEVSLRALLEEFTKANKEKAAEERWEAPEIRFEEEGRYGSNYFSVFFDPKPESSYRSDAFSSSGTSAYSLKHNIHVMLDKETRPAGNDHDDPIRIGEVYCARIDNEKIALSMNLRTKWERMLASLYFGKAKLLVDCDPQDITYGFDY